MGVTVIYTGPDGHTHFRDEAFGPGNAEARAIVFPRHPAVGWEITESPVGFESAVVTPRVPRTLVVLEGELEIRASDGERRTFRAGDVLYATDTNGKGHSSAVPGSRPARVLNIVSTDQIP
jgi:hypothetical protein